ncbi:MAG: polysaccharide biosynthesis tyrosine autokinase [Chloroflexales bacterium]|nr:polysaccharide biosynthesis tyrosine autokinase [Chloroflexales bacterium]
MELKGYLAILWRRRWVVVLTALLTATITGLGSYYLMVPQYSTQSLLWVPTVSSSDRAGTGDIQLGDRLINTYATLALSGPVLGEVERRIGIAVDELKDSLSVESVAQTELLQIKVVGPDPQRAALVATSVAETLIDQTLTMKAGRERRVSLFARAGVPDTPTWMGLIETPFWREINIALGLLVGLVVGVALVFLFEYTDSTLYTKEQIEAVARLNTVAEIPAIKKGQPVLSDTIRNTPLFEAFRLLRTNLYFDQETLPHTLVITSTLPKEGKTTVAINLAVAIAQSGQSVIVVDADMRLPTIHRIFGLPKERGLSDILQQGLVPADVAQATGVAGVRVITSGSFVQHPAEILDTSQIGHIVEELRQQADFIIFDTPALLAVSDAAVLAPVVDGVLLVVGRAQVYQEALQTACKQLDTVNARLVGVVVNRADQDGSYFRQYASSDRSNASGGSQPHPHKN